jgi:hypothetical protein
MCRMSWKTGSLNLEPSGLHRACNGTTLLYMQLYGDLISKWICSNLVLLVGLNVIHVSIFLFSSRMKWRQDVWAYTVVCPLTTRLRMKCDGTRTETRFGLSSKQTSPFKLVGVSVQLTAGSRGVRISGSNAGYTMFWGSVKSTGYPLHSPVSPSLPLPCVTVCHQVSTGLYHFIAIENM